jgi:putative membrane protein
VPTEKPQTSQRETTSRQALPMILANAVSGAALLTLVLAASPNLAVAQTNESLAMSAATKLKPVDYNFVAQANLGAPFQVDSGRIAEKGATTAEIRDYAHLMVVTHIPVVNALNKILASKDIEAPSNTLLGGAYRTMIASLKSEQGTALDRDYIEGQVDYQNGNEALFRNEIENGRDPDLKQFARATLPKIVDHRDRALKLARENTASE